MSEFNVRITSDSTLVEMQILGDKPSATMTAEELENFTRALALLRVKMLPRVPDEGKKIGTVYSVTPVIRWSVELDQDAPTQIRVYLLHPGFGWIWMPLSEDRVNDLSQAMQTALKQRPLLS